MGNMGLSKILCRALILFAGFNIFPLHGCYAASDEVFAVSVIVVGGAIAIVLFILYSTYLSNLWKQLARATGLNVCQDGWFGVEV